MDKSDLSIVDFVEILQRHKRAFALCFVITMSATAVFNMVSPRVYESEAKLLVRLGRENVTLDPAATLGEVPTVNMSQSREFETNSVATILRSRSLAEQVVDSLGSFTVLNETEAIDDRQNALAGFLASSTNLRRAYKSTVDDVSPRDRAIKAIEQDLSVGTVEKTNLVSVAFRSQDPQLSQEIVTEVLHQYLEEHIRIHRAPGEHQFLADQKRLLEETLAKAEQELVDLKTSTGLASPAEQRVVLVERIGMMKTGLLTLEAELAQSELEVTQLTESLKSLKGNDEIEPTVTLSSADATGMRSLLYKLQLEAQDSLAKYSEEHLKVRVLRKQIAEAKSILAIEEATLEIQKRQPALISQRAKAEKLRQQISEAETELAALNENEMKVTQLQREVEIKDASFRELSADAEQSRIDHMLELAKITNISVVQPATKNVYPVFPNAKLNLMLGFVMSMFLGTCVALFSESRTAKSGADAS